MFILFMSFVFAGLWAGICWIPAYGVTLKPASGVPPELRIPIWAGLFLLSMLFCLYRNRARAHEGEIEDWNVAAKREYGFQAKQRRRSESFGTAAGRGFSRDDDGEGAFLLIYFLFLIPQMSVDSFFEFLYSLADEDDSGEGPEGA